MTDQPMNTGGLRGAVDLSGLQGTPPGTSGATGAQSPGDRGVATDGVAGRSGLLVQGSDANFTEIVNASVTVPSVVVLWSGRLPESRAFLDTVLTSVRGFEGRLQVVSVDVDENPGLLRAFQVQSVPMTLGLVQGQPVPLFAGAQPAESLKAVFEELLTLAVQHGVAGRVDLGPVGPQDGAEPEEPALPPLHQEAFDAIERDDLEAATAAYTRALKENPADTDAQIGLAQVGLLQRTAGVDLQAARDAAAAAPLDVDAQILVADLDLLGGHIEDAFLRLVDLVRASAGDERERARTHLVELFSVVGTHDERVKKARNALMSALF